MASCKGLILLVSLTAILPLTVLSQAAVKGECSFCHTMHNSEEGHTVAFTRNSSGNQVMSEQPLAQLLKTDCLGCHTDSAAETIINIGEMKIPIVFNLIEPTYPPDGSATSTLAGGNFHWLLKSGEAYGHNVHGILDADSRFLGMSAPGGTIPVGPDGECTDCHGTLATTQSGCKGCHVALHHTDSAAIVTGSNKGWYRFLGSVMLRDNQVGPPPEGVIGIEAPDWEQNPLVDKHNAYQGEPVSYNYVNYLESGSINQKCAGCHGRFHNETLADTTWIRHPGIATIPDFGDFSGFTTYNPLVPVARPNVNSQDAGFSDINRGSNEADQVFCISCHRAHSSPYPAMLRWGYRDWPGDDSHTGQPAQNGCAVCHTSKD